MSLSTVDDVLRDIENEQFTFSATAKNASNKMYPIHQTVIKELIIEATVPEYRLKMDDLTTRLTQLTSIATGGIIDWLTNSIEGSKSLYNYLLPELASIYACRLVNIMTGSQAVFFLEDCLSLGVYEAIRSWDLDPYTAETQAYQNIPTGYVIHIKNKPNPIKPQVPNKTQKAKLIGIYRKKGARD